MIAHDSFGLFSGNVIMGTKHSPEGFFVYASSYKRAAETLMAQGTSELLVPTIYLLAHSLELALKSYLLFKGVAAKTLANRPYRHDVAHCLSAAEAQGLFALETLTVSQRDAVASASTMFDKKELNYFYEKPTVFPDMEVLRSALHSVLSAVFDRISEPYFREVRS